VHVEDTCPAPIQRALDAAHAVLRGHATASAGLDDALAAGRLVGQLTEDAGLAVGAMLHDAAGGSGRPAEDWPAADRRAIGEPALRIAAELARLGGFGRGARWNTPAGLTADQAETLRKMLLAVVSDPRLVVARLGLQLARLRAAHRSGDAERRRELATEARAVFAPLANRLGIWSVKWELEDLALRELEPEAYRRIATALAERRSERERYVAEACAQLAGSLGAAGLRVEVSGRPKHLHSIHRKMQDKHLDLDRIFDLRGLRVVCETVPDCYAALGVVHSLWSWLPDEFADYIATPKDNGYRSIHTAVLGPGGRVLEVQIRTSAMHEFAERGVAAHWRYKEGGTGDAAYAGKIERVRQLLAPAGGSPREEPADFLDTAQRGLFEDRVYALTPRGEVVDLGRGATPLDFAYQVHTSLGHRCRGARVDGRIVPLTQRLANGEVVEIITGRDEAPSRDWLHQEGFLASARSRAKLRAWFRRRDAGENESAGRALAERELSRLGVGAEGISALVQDLKASDAQQLYRWLGEGEVSVNQLVQAAMRRLQRSAPRDTAAPARDRARRQRPAAASPGGAGAAVAIEGVKDLPITLARCCDPARPRPIAGYVTVGRGVTIHDGGCAALARMRRSHPRRVLEAAWSG
jgi:GTP pyrophosphokinase